MQLGVLVVGCGNIAGRFDHDRVDTDTPFTHAGAYARHGSFAIKACVEPNQQTRESFMKRWGVAAGFSSLTEALDAGLSVDVVSVCSPTSAHFDDLLAALKFSPKLVFCEKPVAQRLAQTELMVERCHQQGVMLAVNYTRRWDPTLIRLITEIRSGAWGKLRCINGVYNKGVLNNGSHLVDLLHLLFRELEIAHAGPGCVDMWPEDPSVPAFLIGDRAVPVMLNVSDARDYSLFEVQFVTERGVISMEEGGLRWRFRMAQDSPTFANYKALGSDQQQSGTLGQATLAAVAEIYNAVRHAGDLSSTGDNALKAQRICEALLARSLACSHSLESTHV